jgi:hypothetical protein
MSKHTPGPWIAVEKFGVLGSVNGGSVREYTNGTSQDQLFMVCSVQEDNGGQEATNANARLIAAAPDLLEALKLCEGNISSLLASTHPRVYGEWLDFVRTAIAKAEGGAA